MRPNAAGTVDVILERRAAEEFRDLRSGRSRRTSSNGCAGDGPARGRRRPHSEGRLEGICGIAKARWEVRSWRRAHVPLSHGSRASSLPASASLWAENGDVLEDVFREQVRHHLRAGVKNLYVFGTAGEGYAVTERQFDEITALFGEEMAGPDAQPMIGLISLSTRVLIERIERSMDRGFDLFQFALPAWGALNDHELGVFCREVLGRFPTARFVHYSLRQRASRILGPAEYALLGGRRRHHRRRRVARQDRAAVGQADRSVVSREGGESH